MTSPASPSASASMTRTRMAALAAMIASAGAVGTGLSLGLPLLALVLESRGISGSWIGINTAVAGIAALAVTPLVTPLAIRIGTLRLLVAALLTMAVSFLGFHAAREFWVWFPLRFLFHGAIGVAFVMSEFWISSLAPPERRGLVMGIYATVLSLGFAVGPLLLASVGSQGFAPFAIGAAVMASAIGPALMARGEPPPLHGSDGRRSVLGFVRAVPAAMLAVLAFGAVESGAMAILPVYGLRLGHSEADAALMVTAAALGNVALQVPLGLLADRVDRPRLLVTCALVGVAGALALPAASVRFEALLAVLFVWGGVTAGLYTVGITHLGNRYSGADLAAANATFVMMYAVGMMAGPPSIGIGLDAHPPHGAAYVIALLFAAYVGAVAFIGPRRKP
ncbi:MFS transporter [Prosthecomicrobium sp. N25]|uniref:MFS transporter n=1 Tax=Prosthecomicrobium sp. N25 TaxID=3129254 RepID=UPI003077BE7F